MIKPLRYIGDPILRKKCRPVVAITPEINQVCKDLLESIYPHNGTGLAAPQIGYDWRIFCIDTGDETDDDGYPLVLPLKIFINPEITYASEKQVSMGEACLSIPGIYDKVLRPETIDIRAMGLDGKMFEEKGLNRWRARAIQHEMDHIDGILFVDRFSEETKKRYENKIKMLEMKYAKASILSGDPFQFPKK